MNAKMADLRRAFAGAGFTDVTTVRSGGNVVFTASQRSTTALETAAERAMQDELGKAFGSFVRSTSALAKLLAADPFADLTLPAGAKRVVTFLRAAPASVPPLPVELRDARVLAVMGQEVLSAYVPTPGDPVFMGLIERTFGKDVTTRTWDTVAKCAAA